MKAEILKYPGARLGWVQEEHKNMGAWFYVEPRIRTVLKKIASTDTAMDRMAFKKIELVPFLYFTEKKRHKQLFHLCKFPCRKHSIIN